MRTALVTAILGDYDTLKPLPEGHGFDEAICITDSQSMFADGWDIRRQSRVGEPRWLAKRPKMRPWEIVDADVWVWVDGQIQVKDGLRDFAVDSLADNPLAAFQHPERDCLFDEAEVCEQRSLASQDMLRRQTNHYRREGMPTRWGLWECAVLVWSRAGEEFGRLWWSEVSSYSLRDQIALPFLLWQMNMKMGTLPGRSRRNPYTAWTSHRRFHG